jgi:hypothetical protein
MRIQRRRAAFLIPRRAAFRIQVMPPAFASPFGPAAETDPFMGWKMGWKSQVAAFGANLEVLQQNVTD